MALHGMIWARKEGYRVAVVGHEAGRDEDGVPAEEDGRCGVHRQVGAGAVRGSEAAVRVGGPVRLTYRHGQVSGQTMDDACTTMCM